MPETIPRSIGGNGEADRLVGRHWRTPGAHVIGHAVDGRRTVLLIPRDRWNRVELFDSAVLGTGFEAAVGRRVDPAVRGEVLSWLDRPAAAAR